MYPTVSECSVVGREMRTGGGQEPFSRKRPNHTSGLGHGPGLTRAIDVSAVPRAENGVSGWTWQFSDADMGCGGLDQHSPEKGPRNGAKVVRIGYPCSDVLASR